MKRTPLSTPHFEAAQRPALRVGNTAWGHHVYYSYENICMGFLIVYNGTTKRAQSTSYCQITLARVGFNEEWNESNPTFRRGWMGKYEFGPHRKPRIALTLFQRNRQNPACHTTPGWLTPMRVNESDGMRHRVRAAASFGFLLYA